MRCFPSSFTLVWLQFALAGFILPVVAHAQVQMDVRVDLTDAPRHLLHISENLPAHPGDNTFFYPKWIPGQHLPAGPIDNVTGLEFHADDASGAVLAWTQDLSDPYSLHVITPASVRSVRVDFDVLDVPSRANTTATRRTSSHVVMLEPSDVVLYPAGFSMRDILVRSTIRMPSGWMGASALEIAGKPDGSLFGPGTTFAPVSLEQFVDSPILAGDHCRQFPVAQELQPRHTLDVCAEHTSDLDVSFALLAEMSGLARQATRLFGSHPYKHYDFLVALSEHLDGDSLEHSQSAGYVVKRRDLKDDAAIHLVSYLIPHEYTHAWCGKYRRPARMVTANFQILQQDDLLWVYEGLTEYYGYVLATRAGFDTPTETIGLFDYAIYMTDRPGRAWRSLQNTANAAPILRNADTAWANWRRDQQDYYREGALLWLEADMKIRSLSAGARSLDDFAALFFSTASGETGKIIPGVVPYEFADVVRALNEVAPYDWASFWTERLNSLAPESATAGLEQAGYSYSESDVMSEAEAGYIKPAHLSDMLRSLGFFVLPDGTLQDVFMHSPAYRAGLGPGDKITAVNGEAYSPDIVARAVRDAKLNGNSIKLTILRDDESHTFLIDYHGGEKYLLLKRNNRPDVLTTRILLARPPDR
jgi:predicted metalloprotease with PDZ domain